jgi:hypothetical protein
MLTETVYNVIYMQARMLVHEKALLTQMNKPLHPGFAVTPTAVGAAQEPTVESGGSSSSAEPASKRSRTESPLVNSVLFDEDRIVSALQKDVDMNIQERAFQLEKERMEHQMSMREREQELANKQGFMEMQKAMMESMKAQTEITNLLLAKLNK